MFGNIYKYKIAQLCGIAMLTILISGACAIHLEPVVRLDRMMLEWFSSSRTLVLNNLFSYVAWAGSGYILLPLVLAHAILLILRAHRRGAVFLVGSYIGGSMLNFAVKLLFARPRPDLFPALGDFPAGFSFPSSHAVQVTVFVLAELILLKVTTEARWFVLINITGGILIFLVCISRVYLQVHYPTDVVTGFLIALLWVIGVATLTLPDHQLRAVSLRCCRIGKGNQP
jgi:undecaprenyl-diphosphatase